MPKVARLIRLDEAVAQNPDVVGAKAARLAQARARGLPVLDGFVAPVGCSRSAIGAGEAALGATGNSGAARSAVYNHPLPSPLGEVAEEAAELGDRLVVRSSSRAEAEGIWAGAFASYLDLRPEELATGVVGCWASVFNPDVLQRAAMAGVSPSEVGMAVLIQPQLPTVWGGVATLGNHGQVKVAAVEGHHASLVAGWENGHRATVSDGDRVQAPGDSPLPEELMLKVAQLVRDVHHKVGWPHIEWGMGKDGKVYLLQAQPIPDPHVSHSKTPPPAAMGKHAPQVIEVVRMMLCYPGPIGARFVWPWAVGVEPLPPVKSHPLHHSRGELIQRVRRLTNQLELRRWPDGPKSKAFLPTLAKLFRGERSAITKLFSDPGELDSGSVATLLESLIALAELLTRSGDIPGPGWMWYLDPDSWQAPRAFRESRSRRIGITQWDPFIYGAVGSGGRGFSAYPAAGGWGVGRLQVVASAAHARELAPRQIIAAHSPTANLAPLLWSTAGLITRRGSPGAHLFEVARSLGVPAVCGIDTEDWAALTHQSGEETPIVAIDGNLGQVAHLPG